MRILIVSETHRAALGIVSNLKILEEYDTNHKSYAFGKMQVDVLITGIGTPFLMYQLMSILRQFQFDMVLNIGLAESFDHFLEQGFVVNVVQDQFADLGIEQNSNFYTLGEKELMNDNVYPFHEGRMLSLGNYDLAEMDALIPVKGITVNSLRDNPNWINLMRKKFEPEIQTLTGAAFFYTCLMEKVPFIQIRAISGFVEIQRVDSWNIPVALNNLAETTLEIMKELRND